MALETLVPLPHTPPTPEQVLEAIRNTEAELFAWATGQRSWINETMNMEELDHFGGPVNRAATLLLVTQRDTAELENQTRRLEALMTIWRAC